MLFSSIPFIFLFLPITWCAYFGLGKLFNHTVAKVWLVLACLFFYGWFNPPYLWIICSSVIVNYLLAEAMGHSGAGARKCCFWLGLLFNLGMIGYYKYYDFFIGTVNSVFGQSFALKHILLPLGISFFTFQQMSYLYDIWSGNLKKNYSLLDYTLFVTFFPQLIAGPIVLPQEMMPQFADKNNQHVNYSNCAAGLYLFSIGFVKKIIFADFFAIWANEGFAANRICMFDAWLAMIGYTYQLYFDFSGYCDMAIGLGRMFNIKIPLNFNSPYKSGSIQEFWRNWHITLGRFLTTFVYIPLGGSKKGIFRTLFNLMVTFLVSGLWHGASWLFIIWGALHGIAICIHRIWSKALKLKMPAFPAIALTFLFVGFAFVIFRAENMAEALKIYKGMFDFSTIKMMNSEYWHQCSSSSLFMFIVGSLMLFACPNAATRIDDFKPSVRNAVFTVLLFVAGVFTLNRLSPFIYFNF